ncbi:hypothetical protein [Williamsia sp.]
MRWTEDGVEYLENEPLAPWEVAIIDQLRAQHADDVQSGRAT